MKQVPDILLVEDNPGDVRLFREALGNRRASLHVCRDGVEALAFLRRTGEHSAAPRPDLVVMDFNMPRKSGREILAEAKSDPELQTIPMIVLTSSLSPLDIQEAYRLHANCYVNKPLDLDAFFETVGAIERFWLSVVQLPAE